MKWSMEGVHRVVHGRGPKGGPWTGGQCFQLSLELAYLMLHTVPDQEFIICL